MSDKTQKKEHLKAAVATIEKAYGKGSVQCLGDAPDASTFSVIHSGSLALDEALGIGGYPRGRIVEVFGPESSGKTTLTLHAIASVQRAGGTAAFIDAEHAFDIAYAKSIGVDVPRLLVAQPDFGEQALDIAEILPKAEIDGDMGDAHMGLQARLMSQALRKLTPIAHKTDTTFMFINQLRQKIGVIFGSPETTTGGNALKFFASVRIDVRRIGKVTVGETVIGNRTRAKVVKNKCAHPFTEAEFDIRWGIVRGEEFRQRARQGARRRARGSESQSGVACGNVCGVAVVSAAGRGEGGVNRRRRPATSASATTAGAARAGVGRCRPVET
jgi:recombination protein RecA